MSNEITYESMRRAVGVSQAAAAAADPITRILTSPFLPQDVKAQFSDEALRKRIRARCDQLLRQMKAAAGINLTRHDTKETRSAIVLEFVLRTGFPDERDGHSSVRALPLGVLASQVGVKKEFAEDTQRALVHYLNDAANVVDDRRKTRSSGPGFDTTDEYASGRVGNGMSNSRVGTSLNAGIESNAAAMVLARDVVARSLQQPETIRDLSIRLGSMVEDGDGSARKGEALFETVVNHILDSTDIVKSSQKALLSDIKRNKSSYEAACFYLSVNDSEGAGSGSTKKKKSNSAKAGTGDGAQSDEDEERNLTLSDIMDAAKLGNRKNFEEIVHEVSRIAAKIRLQREANNEEERTKREGTELQRTESATKGAKKRQRADSKITEEQGPILPQDILMAAEEKEWRNDVSDGTNSASKQRSKRSLPAFVPSARFVEWKKRTLDAAIARAKSESGDDQMTNQEALEWAVKDVISRKD